MSDNKSIILFRHGKSDWDADYGHDHERPVAKRGIKAAKQMGSLLAKSKQLPDLAICSTALRARQTLELASRKGKWDVETHYTDLLYEASTHDIITMLHDHNHSASCIMLVGHEPTWSNLAVRLIGGGSVRFPTAAMAKIDFYFNDWRGLDSSSGQLQWLLQPRFFS